MFLRDREGDWWVGTRAGVLRFRNLRRLEQLAHAVPSAMYSKRNGLAADVVIRLFEDSRGDVWISTVGEGHGPNGLSRWERMRGVLHHYPLGSGLPPPDQFYASAFAEDDAGNVWIGYSGDGGLVRYRNGQLRRFTAADGMPPGAVRNLFADSRGRLWVASYSSGLVLLEAPTADAPVFRRYTTTEGLSSNEVHAIVDDTTGRIYVGTARGLDRLDPSTGRVKSYRAGDGPLLGEMQAALRDGTGALWFSYNSGLVRLVPRSEPRSEPPPVLITGIRVMGQTFMTSAVGEPEVSAFELPAHRNSLDIEFVAPDYGPRDGLKYQMKLEGARDSWGRPSDHQTVSYANLRPGSYRFVVRAITAEGISSTTVASVPFTIRSPIWMQWWFVSLVALIAPAVAFSLHRHRVSRLWELANVRARIADDLHDDIGANLTRIAVLAEVARRQCGDGGTPADDHLVAIASVARESVTTMSDIVWAVNPERDSVQELGRKMRELAEEVFSAKAIRLTMTVGEASHDRKLGVNVRRDVYLIFKEAVNNIARHACCSQVHIRFAFDRGYASLDVIDDGIGFDCAVDSDGNGLANMQRRAERLGGRLTIMSAPGAGTTVRLVMPVTAVRALPRLNR